MKQIEWLKQVFKKTADRHYCKVVQSQIRYTLTCTKCSGEWEMWDKDRVQPIMSRPYVNCPHCGKKAEIERNDESNEKTKKQK